MPGQLIPIDLEIDTEVPSSAPPKTLYAMMTRTRIEQLARAMPDGQSAILACLLWQASLHERMRLGPFAGRLLASMSGPQLAKMTGRDLRSVRHSLNRLTVKGLVFKEKSSAGRKNIYHLSFLVEDRRVAGCETETS